jgi:signal transduction histidine kinase
VFGVGFTAVMLRGWVAVATCVGELALYAAICVIAYRWPGTVLPLPDERAVLVDTVVGFSVAASVLATCLFLHFRIYDERQRDLAELNEILEGASRVKSEFLSLLSHEMRTPLAAVSVNVQAVREIISRLGGTAAAGGWGQAAPAAFGGLAEPAAGELLEGAQEEIMRLARMVGGMLTLSSLSGAPGKGEVDLSELMRCGAEAMRLSLARRGNSLAVEAEPGLSVLGVADFLAQVETNLLQNANAHTRDGAITVRAARSGGEAVVTVTDTGTGIDPELLPRVFERGVSDGGTGFGLYLCRTVVESLGGRIWIESEPGRGTAASFALPAVDAAAEDADGADGADGEGADGP